jgi:hypothetical protein
VESYEVDRLDEHIVAARNEQLSPTVPIAVRRQKEDRRL